MIKGLLVVGIALLSASFAFAENAKVARELDNASPGTAVKVIVQFKQAPTARHHQKVTARGGTLRAELKSVKAGAYTVCIEAAREHGTHQILRQEMDFNGTAKQVELKGGTEISAASLDYGKKAR